MCNVSSPNHGRGHGHHRDDDDDRGRHYYSDHDRDAMRDWYHDRDRDHHLPPGLSKHDQPPPVSSVSYGFAALCPRASKVAPASRRLSCGHLARTRTPATRQPVAVNRETFSEFRTPIQ